MKNTMDEPSFRPFTVEDHKELGRRHTARNLTAVNDALGF